MLFETKKQSSQQNIGRLVFECHVYILVSGFFIRIRPQKIDILFLRHFFEKTNERGRNFFLLFQIFFSCFPVNSNVKHCVIPYILPLITTVFSRTARCNTVLMFYNITRVVTIAFNALRNAVVWSNLRKLSYSVNDIRKTISRRFVVRV